MITSILGLALVSFSSPASESGVSSDSDGAPESLSVYWVGHSLMEGKADSSFGHGSMMDIFARFVRSRGIPYRKGDHTLWGAPLSLQWSGIAHSNKREEPRQKYLREKFELTAERYDTLILTETVPIENAFKYDFSPYYLRQFYCAFLNANPSGKVYLYESWRGIQYLPEYPDGEQLMTREQWRSIMREDREKWNELARMAGAGEVMKPGVLSKLLGLIGMDKPVECDSAVTIQVIPIGTALVHLSEEMDSDDSAFQFYLPDGSQLELIHLFSNPYRHWPQNSDDVATSEAASGAQETNQLVDPDRNWDEIHASAIGMYFSALVTFATVVKESPLGLPYMRELGEPVSRSLQKIAWQVVSGDPMTGID